MNKSKMHRFIETSFIFFAGSILSKVVSFFLLPLYTEKIVPEQYGAYDLVMSLVNLIVPIAFLQIWDAMFRFAFDYDEIEDKKKVISNTIPVMFFGAIAYFFLLTIIHIFFKFDYFLYVLIFGLIYAVRYEHTYCARLFLDNKLFVFSGLANTLLNALLNILFISFLGWDIKGIYLSAIISEFSQLVIIELRVGVFRHFRLKYADKKLVREMIKFSIPLCVATVSYWLLSGFTRLIIVNTLGEHSNGIYAVANRFASIVTLIVSVFQFAWNEAAYSMARDNNRTNIYGICIDIMNTGVAFGTALFCLVVKVVFPYMVDAQYAAALALVPATIIGVGANSLAGFFGTFFMTEKKTNFVFLSTMVAALLNIVFGTLGAHYFGLHGAVIALSVSFVLLMILRLLKLKKAYSIKISLPKVLLQVAVIIISIGAFYFVSSNILIIGLCVVLSGLFIFCMRKHIVLLISGFKKKIEKSR